ncbi:cytochrome c oxidase assembly protein [Falsiroseomonas sp.]|uniref:cytochrome c oxidase assembly protein n=1 Tax=Falsiroseomonas sp. TaxID=2870721 RepID=UPI003567BF26
MNGIPFCGAPPLPSGAAWNFDPLLLAALAAAGLGLAREIRGAPAARRAAVASGWLLLGVALVSPLCNLAVALFSVRIAQHLLITLVAAPLLALAFAGRQWPRGHCLPAAALFGALLWFWHLPLPYVATFAADGIAWWWLHATLVLSATWLWAAILAALPARPEAAALGGLVTGVQMGVLGALLTFAPRPLYAPHAPDVTLPWGLTPLEDQQLGGLVMWVPGGLLFAAVMVAVLATVLRGPVLREQARRAVPALLLCVVLAPAVALAQGNDSTTAAGTDTARRTAPVGVLTTPEVTTGSSGPAQATAAEPATGDWRTRVLAPVCRGLAAQPELLAECRAKSGL